jgi:hypothetical protein
MIVYKTPFGNSSEDYNRVLNQLITFNTFYETRFCSRNGENQTTTIGKEKDYEERFMDIIEKNSCKYPRFPLRSNDTFGDFY